MSSIVVLKWESAKPFVGVCDTHDQNKNEKIVTEERWLCLIALLCCGGANFASVQLCRMTPMHCVKASLVAVLCGEWSELTEESCCRPEILHNHRCGTVKLKCCTMFGFLVHWLLRPLLCNFHNVTSVGLGHYPFLAVCFGLFHFLVKPDFTRFFTLNMLWEHQVKPDFIP